MFLRWTITIIKDFVIFFKLRLCFTRIHVPSVLFSWRVPRVTAAIWNSTQVSTKKGLRQGTDLLTKGGFAKCYEVTDEESNVRYACKVIDKELLSQSHMK